MGTKIVTLDSRRPHVSGKAICIACKHEWVEVSPVGTIWIKCPKCNLLRGRYKFPCVRDLDHWECDCGNDLFHVVPEGIYCPNCGEWQNGY